MAVIQTPKGRIIGLVVDDSQPQPEQAANVEAVEEEQRPRRGRPKKQ